MLAIIKGPGFLNTLGLKKKIIHKDSLCNPKAAIRLSQGLLYKSQ
jgi:hypothetical protein